MLEWVRVRVKAVLMDNIPILQLLLNKGGDINTALTLAAKSGQELIVKFLVDQGTDPNVGMGRLF
jgi:hypothetical protein